MKKTFCDCLIRSLDEAFVCVAVFVQSLLVCRLAVNTAE